jgi:hypothetical protein
MLRAAARRCRAQRGGVHAAVRGVPLMLYANMYGALIVAALQPLRQSIHRCGNSKARCSAAERRCDPLGVQTGGGGGGGVLAMAKGTALFDAVAISGTYAVRAGTGGAAMRVGPMRIGAGAGGGGAGPIAAGVAVSAVRSPAMAAWFAWTMGPSRSRAAGSMLYRCALHVSSATHSLPAPPWRVVRCMACYTGALLDGAKGGLCGGRAAVRCSCAPG